MEDDYASESVNFMEEQVQLVTQLTNKEDSLHIGNWEVFFYGRYMQGLHELSLKIHLKKNNAPGVEEGFKALSISF